MYPQTDMINNLVYAADGADVVLTMADGRVLYKDGEFTTIDIEKVKSTVNAAASRIISEVKKMADIIERNAEYIRSKITEIPKTAIVLGSGLGDMGEKSKTPCI